MAKILKFSIFVFGILVLSLSFVGQAQAANVEFTADTKLGFTNVPVDVYVKSGSKCDSLTVSTSTLNVDVLADDTFTLIATGTPSYTVLALTPSGGKVTLAFDTSYFGTGYVSQWTASSSLSSATVSFSIGGLLPVYRYLVKVDNVDLGSYISDSGGLVT